MEKVVDRVNAKIDAEVKKQAQKKAIDEGLHLQDAIELLLDAWVVGEVEIAKDEEGKDSPAIRAQMGAAKLVGA